MTVYKKSRSINNHSTVSFRIPSVDKYNTKKIFVYRIHLNYKNDENFNNAYKIQTKAHKYISISSHFIKGK